MVAAILSGITALQNWFNRSSDDLFYHKTKIIFSIRSQIIKEFSNKIYVLYEKCIEDGVTTLEEI